MNIYCGITLESSRWDDSNDIPQYIGSLWRITKNIYIIKKFYVQKNGLILRFGIDIINNKKKFGKEREKLDCGLRIESRNLHSWQDFQRKYIDTKKNWEKTVIVLQRN